MTTSKKNDAESKPATTKKTTAAKKPAAAKTTAATKKPAETKKAASPKTTTAKKLAAAVKTTAAKLAAKKPTAAKKSEAVKPAAKKPAATKAATPAKTAAAKKPAAKKPTVTKAATPAKTAAAKKPAATKAAATAKPAAAKAATAKKPAAAKAAAAAKKPAAKTTTAAKPAAKKPATEKTTAAKPAAAKTATAKTAAAKKTAAKPAAKKPAAKKAKPVQEEVVPQKPVIKKKAPLKKVMAKITSDDGDVKHIVIDESLVKEDYASFALASDELLQALVNSLNMSDRRIRQYSASVLAMVAREDKELLNPYADNLVDALNRPEAQTRWEALDALFELIPNDKAASKEAIACAEDSLNDDKSGLVRLSAFRFLCKLGTESAKLADKVWPSIDEGIQLYHGDNEFQEMLNELLVFAEGNKSPKVKKELAARMKFDAGNGRGALKHKAEAIVAACK